MTLILLVTETVNVLAICCSSVVVLWLRCDVVSILVIHNVQGCPRFARIAGCGHIFCGAPTKQKKVKRNRARLQPQIKNGYAQ